MLSVVLRLKAPALKSNHSIGYNCAIHLQAESMPQLCKYWQVALLNAHFRYAMAMAIMTCSVHAWHPLKHLSAASGEGCMGMGTI